MADGTLILYTGTTATLALEDVESLTVGANTVLRQRNQIAGTSALEIARVLATTPAGTEMGLAVRLVGPVPPGAAALGAVTVSALVPGTAATNLGKAIDGAVGASDTGVLGLNVRRDRDTLVTLTPVDGDFVPCYSSAIGGQWVEFDHMPLVVGSVAHDSPDTYPPVKIGGFASAVLRTAVAESDRVDASFDLQGRLRAAGVLSGGGLGISERAGTGTSPITQVNVVAATATGVVLIAANAAGTRRRVVVTNTTAKVVWINAGDLTAGGVGVGEPLAGVIGAHQSFFVASALKATCATADTSAIVSVREEVLGS